MRVDARFRSSDGTGWCLAVQAWGLPSLPRLGAIWVLLLAGCGGSEFAIAPVSGTVTQDGKPLADVVVTFQPIAETRAGSAGPGSFGVTDDQGRFTLTVAGSRQSGAVVGLHRVMFSAKARERDSSDDTVDRSSPTLFPPGYPSDSIEFEVPSQGTKEANFSLEPAGTPRMPRS
jgi:hypothetical protein